MEVNMKPAVQISQSVLKAYFTLLNRTYEVRGHETLPDGPKIIAMNHTPGFDPLYLPFLLKETPHFLLQDGLFSIPLIGWILKGSGQIPVHRGTARAKDAMDQACALLHAGGVIAIFPEGRDVPRGHRIPARSGAVRMSLQTGAPIVPLGLYAPAQSLTQLHFEWNGALCSGAWQFSGKSHMRFGSPWMPKPESDIHAQTGELMDRIYSLVAEAERESLCMAQALYHQSRSEQWRSA
jgi:1-acyl-sn-glycerol-3-phosphate acyltransferase